MAGTIKCRRFGICVAPAASTSFCKDQRVDSDTIAWRVPQFRRLWAAGLFSTLGSEIGELALPVLALTTLGASAQELSWVRIATFAPYLVATLWLGVLVDRRRRRPLMVIADLGRATVLLSIAALAVGDVLDIPILVAGSLIVGTFGVLYTLADFSLLPLVVSERQLPDANAKVTATQSAVGVGGSGTGGLLVQLLTAPFAVVLNALGFIASALLINGASIDEPVPEPKDQESPVRAARLGMTALLRDKSLRALSVEATIWNLGNEVFTLAVTVVVVREFAGGPLLLGLVLMSGGIGAFLGSAISARLTHRFGYGRSLVGALLVGNTAPVVGALTLGTHTYPALAGLAAAYLLSGFGIGVANSQAVTVRQLLTAPELRGRLNAAYRLLSWGALAIGALVAGLVITGIGAPTAGILGACVMALATVPVAASPVRSMRALSSR